MSLIVSEIDRLEALCNIEEGSSFYELSLQAKRKKLEAGDTLKSYLSTHPWLADIYESSEPLSKIAIASLVWIKQAPLLLEDPDLLVGGWNKWHSFLEAMKGLEQFYAPVGGIIGYQLQLLKCLAIQLGDRPGHTREKVSYTQPPRIDVRRHTPEVQEAINLAVQNWNKVGLMIPVGGAGDRLGLEDDQGHPLPAAFLPFEGQNLLEGIIQDLEAVELMIEQLTGIRHYTPIAMMTSDEKDNHQRIEQMLKDKHYLGRPMESIRLFGQKRVPVVTEYGQWASEGPLEPMLKPGGHGVIWRGAEVSGIFDWFNGLNRTHALVRQINNPMAATDYNLLALVGFAFKSGQAMGFLSCERIVHASEGVNVWRVCERQGKPYSCITNVEYTDFDQEGIQDIPEEEGSAYSAFSSNTNIFIVQLEAIRQVVHQHPFPGLILNLKSRAQVRMGHELNLVRIGRLESMMQNIADSMESESREEACLKQFLLFGDRAKVISVAKNHVPAMGFVNETPTSAFFDRQMMWRQLLCGSCQMALPMATTPEEYYQRVPPFVVNLSPLLGPLHSWLVRRIKGGTLARGSYCHLDLCHLLVQNLYLDGALRITASEPQKAYVWLHQVTVVNPGWDEAVPVDFWKGIQLPKHRLDVHFEGSGIFLAQYVNFEGERQITVPDGCVVIASVDERGLLQIEQKSLTTSCMPAGFTQFVDWSRKQIGFK